MSKIGKKAKEFFGNINTTHARHQLPSGDIVDLSSEEVTDSELLKLANASPDIFVLKAVKAESATATPAPKKVEEGKNDKKDTATKY